VIFIVTCKLWYMLLMMKVMNNDGILLVAGLFVHVVMKRRKCSPEVEAFNYIALAEDPDYLVEKFVDEDIGTFYCMMLCRVHLCHSIFNILSVHMPLCLSVSFMYFDHIDLNFCKIISWPKRVRLMCRLTPIWVIRYN